MRTVRVLGASLAGTSAELVTVEARFDARAKERTEVVLTGLPDSVLRESRGKLLGALDACGFRIGQGRLYLNLVPAARRKSGESLDLPLVIGAIAATGHLGARAVRGVLFLGEVGIDGTLHAVPGGLPAALAGREKRLRALVAPTATATEAACIPELAAFGARHLTDVVGHLSGGTPLAPATPLDNAPLDSRTAQRARGGTTLGAPEATESRSRAPDELDDVRGCAEAKLALAAAAAGGHGLLFVGPPGAGKSMLARRLPALLPPPTLEDRIAITCVLSAVGRWPGGLAPRRPFRAPHHTTSYAGLVGGGSPPAPGEITLAHGGVLFLDELPEFRRDTLEALRQPLESGVACVSRAGRRVEFPARFQLVAAMNPCPCGHRGDERVPCRCPPTRVEAYRRRVSGPLLDRIDLRLELRPPSLDELSPARNARAPVAAGPRGEQLRAAVTSARARMAARQGDRPNALLEVDDLDRWVPLAGRTRAFVERAVDVRGLSARAVQSLRRVARTLADLDGAKRVEQDHCARALALRAPLEPP